MQTLMELNKRNFFNPKTVTFGVRSQKTSLGQF